MESSRDKINCNQLTSQPKSLSKAWGSVINPYLSAKLRRDRKISKCGTLGLCPLYFPSFTQGVKKEQRSTGVFLSGLCVCVCVSQLRFSLWRLGSSSVGFSRSLRYIPSRKPARRERQTAYSRTAAVPTSRPAEGPRRVCQKERCAFGFVSAVAGTQPGESSARGVAGNYKCVCYRATDCKVLISGFQQQQVYKYHLK